VRIKRSIKTEQTK